MKTKIPSLSYDAMFKAVFRTDSYILSRLTQAILDYYKIDINVIGKKIIIKNSELKTNNYKDRKLIADYIIKVDEHHEIDLEINKSRYGGLNERKLSYSFKIYYDHFNVGNNYKEFSMYTLLQVNFNNFHNPNGKCINEFYLIDAEDINNRLSNNYSIMNIDIDKCHDMVYNKNNLEEISDLITFGKIIACEYLEDIASILESELMSMSKEEKEKFLDDVKNAGSDKDVLKAISFETTIEERFKWIEDASRADEREKVTKEDDIKYIKAMLKNNLDYTLISNISGKTIEEIKKIESEEFY